MKAIGYQKPQAISEPDALIDIALPDPIATGRDLLANPLQLVTLKKVS